MIICVLSYESWNFGILNLLHPVKKWYACGTHRWMENVHESEKKAVLFSPGTVDLYLGRIFCNRDYTAESFAENCDR